MLVVCTGNRARSQMAEGWLRQVADDGLEVRSAGTEPKGVHPLAIEATAEVGIDITGQRSEHVLLYADQDFDLVVTVCDDAKCSCPVFPGARRVLQRAFEDPD
jgi:arsenate reductase